MLKDLQKLFRDTWSAFRAEAGRREPEDEVAALLGLMRREMVDARAELPLLEDAVRSAAAELARERSALVDCDRRAGMAARIGDTETERVAREFGARHRQHIGVLEQKRAAAAAEHALRKREVQEMAQRYRAADANRFALVAELRRQRAAGSVRDAASGGAFAEFARMEEAVAGESAYADALGDLGVDLPDDLPPEPDPNERIRSLEQRLEELKRRMGKG